MKTWVKVTAGILSAFEAHNKGSVVGARVRTVLNDDYKIEGVVTEMGRSDMSSVYYDFRIREDSQKRGGLISVPLSHPFEFEKEENMQTDAERKNKYASLDRITEEPEFCIICKQKIEVMSFKGTAVCSTNCTKIYCGESVEQTDDHPKGSA